MMRLWRVRLAVGPGDGGSVREEGEKEAKSDDEGCQKGDIQVDDEHGGQGREETEPHNDTVVTPPAAPHVNAFAAFGAVPTASSAVVDSNEVQSSGSETVPLEHEIQAAAVNPFALFNAPAPAPAALATGDGTSASQANQAIASVSAGATTDPFALFATAPPLHASGVAKVQHVEAVQAPGVVFDAAAVDDIVGKMLGSSGMCTQERFLATHHFGHGTEHDGADEGARATRYASVNVPATSVFDGLGDKTAALDAFCGTWGFKPYLVCPLLQDFPPRPGVGKRDGRMLSRRGKKAWEKRMQSRYVGSTGTHISGTAESSGDGGSRTLFDLGFL